MNRTQYLESLASEGLRIASSDESGWTHGYYDDARGEKVATWITDAPAIVSPAKVAQSTDAKTQQYTFIKAYIAGEIPAVWQMMKDSIIAGNPQLSPIACGCKAAVALTSAYFYEVEKLEDEFQETSRNAHNGSVWANEDMRFDWMDASERKTFQQVVMDLSGHRSLIADVEAYRLEEARAIQVANQVSVKKSQADDTISLDWTTRPCRMFNHHTRTTKVADMAVVTIPNARGKGSNEYDVWGTQDASKIAKITLVRRWSGGGKVMLHWLDGTTQEVRYGKQERRPSAMNGKSKDAKMGWI